MKYKILLVLFAIAFIASAILTFVPTEDACRLGGEGTENGCISVQNSEYAKTFGIRNCHMGFVIFLFLLGLTYSQIKAPRSIKRQMIHLGTIIGTIIALYFLYIQEFVLHSYCKYCLVVDFAMVAAFIIMAVKWRK